MTIAELLIELRITAPEADPASRFAAEIQAQRTSSSPGAFTWARSIVAGALVRLGLWLDRHASERLLRPTAN